MRRYALRDDQWDRIKDFLPGREGYVGGTAADNPKRSRIDEQVVDKPPRGAVHVRDVGRDDLLPAGGSSVEQGLIGRITGIADDDIERAADRCGCVSSALASACSTLQACERGRQLLNRRRRRAYGCKTC